MSPLGQDGLSGTQKIGAIFSQALWHRVVVNISVTSCHTYMAQIHREKLAASSDSWVWQMKIVAHGFVEDPLKGKLESVYSLRNVTRECK